MSQLRDHLLSYCLTIESGFAFNTDLNLLRENRFEKMIGASYNMTVCGNELFAFSKMDTLVTALFQNKKCNVYKFDRFIVDWVTVDHISNMFWFSNRRGSEIGLMVKEHCTKARSLLLDDLSNHGCQIKPSTEELYHMTVFENESYALSRETRECYKFNTSTTEWEKFNLNNLFGCDADIGFMEREQQRKSMEHYLL